VASPVPLLRSRFWASVLSFVSGRQPRARPTQTTPRQIKRTDHEDAGRAERREGTRVWCELVHTPYNCGCAAHGSLRGPYSRVSYNAVGPQRGARPRAIGRGAAAASRGQTRNCLEEHVPCAVSPIDRDPRCDRARDSAPPMSLCPAKRVPRQQRAPSPSAPPAARDARGDSRVSQSPMVRPSDGCSCCRHWLRHSPRREQSPMEGYLCARTPDGGLLRRPRAWRLPRNPPRRACSATKLPTAAAGESCTPLREVGS
jgi:hypothetical protein